MIGGVWALAKMAAKVVAGIAVIYVLIVAGGAVIALHDGTAPAAATRR